ncbi:type 4a pilus biogenesis protein PilO [uncultured Thalassolituus sp.]|uniref:type 4a pilus biogenesis protein PilO n=1 Tax=uncultured Thalassolituus sp. TaxID=285273 RepID=UPI0026027FAF|nr:type 4a pilus biogenesis protein PilO [uncultured Thalassolituus sp.]
MADNNFLADTLEQIRSFDPNDIDWNNMGSWPIIGKAVLCVSVVAAIGTMGYFLAVLDERDRLASAQNQEVKLKKDFESKAFRVANLEEYKAQMTEMETTFGSLLKQLPRDTEVPGLIDDISAAALNSGLELRAIDPRAIVATEFYNELPIDIEVVGGYHEMGAFVSAVAALPRIVTLHDFSIKKDGKSDRLSMKILAKTYQYDADAKPAAPGGKGAKR